MSQNTFCDQSCWSCSSDLCLPSVGSQRTPSHSTISISCMMPMKLFIIRCTFLCTRSAMVLSHISEGLQQELFFRNGMSWQLVPSSLSKQWVSSFGMGQYYAFQANWTQCKQPEPPSLQFAAQKQHRSSSWQMQVCMVLWETPWFSHNVTSVWNNIDRFQMRSIPSLQSWKFIWGWDSIWWHLLTLYQQNHLLSSSGLTISTMSSSKSTPISISCAWLGEGLVAPLQCGFCLIYCLVQHQQISDKIPSSIKVLINLNLLVTLFPHLSFHQGLPTWLIWSIWFTINHWCVTADMVEKYICVSILNFTEF